MNFRPEELVGNFCLLLASEVDSYSDGPVCVDVDVGDSPCLYSVTTDESKSIIPS